MNFRICPVNCKPKIQAKVLKTYQPPEWVVAIRHLLYFLVKAFESLQMPGSGDPGLRKCLAKPTADHANLNHVQSCS
jgi:hypothetical protein